MFIFSILLNARPAENQSIQRELLANNKHYRMAMHMLQNNVERSKDVFKHLITPKQNHSELENYLSMKKYNIDEISRRLSDRGYHASYRDFILYICMYEFSTLMRNHQKEQIEKMSIDEIKDHFTFNIDPSVIKHASRNFTEHKWNRPYYLKDISIKKNSKNTKKSYNVEQVIGGAITGVLIAAPLGLKILTSVL